MNSAAASLFVEDCSCNAGFFGENGDLCVSCPIGKYKEVQSSEDCVNCYAHSSTLATGSNTSFQCLCNLGFEEEYAGVSCLDIDECARGTHDCASFQAHCTNTPGSFSCSCNEPLYAGNGTVCWPEASAVQVIYVAFSNVHNLPDPLEYAAPFASWLSIQVSDVKVDRELHFNPSAPSRKLLQAPINSTLFSFTAHVEGHRIQSVINASNDLDGFNLLLVSLSLKPFSAIQQLAGLTAQCGNGLLEIWETCDDGNVFENDGCSSTCQTETGWVCQPENFSWFKHNRSASMCSDINECQDCKATLLEHTVHNSSEPCSLIAKCSQYASCINNPGSYLCVCRPGFLGEGLQCLDDLSNNDTLQRSTAFSESPVPVLRAFASQVSSVPNFGISVALSGGVALVGSEGSTIALVFERGVEGEWMQAPTHTFFAPTSSALPSYMFGNNVALHISPISMRNGPQRKFVKASCAAIATSDGAIYIYHREPGARWEATPTAILSAESNDEIFFGASLALSADHLLVGVPGSNSASVFTRPARNKYGDTLKWPAKPSYRLDGHSNILMLGQNVALSEKHAAVASYSMTTVVLFHREADGSWPRTGVILQPLHPPADPVTSRPSMFGASISLSASFLVVGDPIRRLVTVFSVGDHVQNATDMVRSHLQPGGGALFADCVSNTDLYLVVGARGSNRAYIFKSFQNRTWPAFPVQVLTYHAPEPAVAVGSACVLNNQDLLLPSFRESNGQVFVHSTSCAHGYYGFSSDHCLQCPPGTVSRRASRTVHGCECLPGTFGPGGGPCPICPKNRYCEGGSAATACPGNTTSSNGSSVISDCQINEWILKTVSHSTSLPGAENTLQFNISLNLEIESTDQPKFILSELFCGDTHCRPCPGGLAFTSSTNTRNSNGVSKAVVSDTCAGCGLINGTLVVQHVGHTVEREVIFMSFCLVNPETAQAAATLYIAAAGGVDVQAETMDNALGSRAPLAILGIVRATGFQSNPNQLDFNLITLYLDLTAVPTAQTQVMVLGLNFSNSSGSDIEFRGQGLQSSSAFCSAGTWSRTTFTLTAPICQEAPRPERLTLQFRLQNFDEISYQLHVRAQLARLNGTAVDIRQVSLAEGKLVAEQRIGVVAGFRLAHISQSSSSPGAINELTATLISSIPLYIPTRANNSDSTYVLEQGARLTVSGLTGSPTYYARHPIRLQLGRMGENSIEFVSSTGWVSHASWEQLTGTLTFNVDPAAAKAEADRGLDVLIVTWSLENPSAGQAARELISIKSDYVRISPINMTQGLGTRRVLLVAGLFAVTTAQSSACPGGTNTLSVAFTVLQDIPYNVSRNQSSPELGLWDSAELLITGVQMLRM
jgi:cysteine-rich repeat protein